MPATHYTVETRAQGAVILASSQELRAKLVVKCVHLGLEQLTINMDSNDPEGQIQKIADFAEGHDIDYAIIVLTKSLAHWMRGEGRQVWQELAPHLQGTVVIASPNGQPLDLEVEGTIRHVELGEYLEDLPAQAGGREGAPRLDNLINEAQAHATLTLPGDGLGEYSLLTPDDLALGLMKIATARRVGEGVITLVGPRPISYLALAHLIAQNFDKQIKITFDDRAVGGASRDWEAINQTYTKLGIILSGEIQEELATYLKNARVAPSSKPPAPVQEVGQEVRPAVPKLTRLVHTPQRELERETPGVRPVKPEKRDQGLVFVPVERLAHKPKLSNLKAKLKSLRPAKKIKKRHPLVTIVTRGLVIALGLYVGMLAFAGTIVALHARHLSSLASQGNLATFHVSGLTKFSGNYLRANIVAASSLPFIKNNETMQDLVLLSDVYNQGLKVIETGETLATAAGDIASYILTDEGGDIAGHISGARLAAEEVYERLSLLDGTLPSEPPKLIEGKKEAYGELKKTLAEAKKNTITLKALLAVAPDVIALGGRAKYAVLFQNNMELRGTGGFIGSFALISFENGRLYDMPVYDVYAADGQLKGHVEPPAAIKDVLGEANWYLRDSNFDPDYPTSARRAEWFIKKSMGMDVQGTVAITLDVLKELLAATGPLEISDYNESVNEGNIYERAQFHAEVNFFPGSQAKKEFLSSVADALFVRLSMGDSLDSLKLAQVLAKMVEQKSIVISVLDPKIENVLQTLSWNGEITSHPCPGSGTCVEDYAFLVDSNFGVNKANYYVSKETNLGINVDKDGGVSHALAVKYKNGATSSAWPAGPYKNYARLYLPFGTQLESLKVGDKVLGNNDLTLSEEHGKLVVAFLMTVPVGTEMMVEARYTTREVLKAGSLYTWYWQKQSGTKASDPLTVTFNYPLYLKPEVVSPQGELLPQQLKFNFVNDTDHRVTIKFAP